MSVDISKIRLDGGTQSRAAINEATVAEYAEAMADPATVFPPVIVYFDGKDYWLADGFHRLAAWAQIGRTEIPTDVRQGDRRRAILHSVAANSAHGLRRTNDDKRRAVMTLLEDPEWSAWTDREIARQCAVSHPFVAKLREALTGNVSSEPRTYTTKHGTEATMQTAKIGSASRPDQEAQRQQAQDKTEDPARPDRAASKDDQETPAASEVPEEEIAPEVAAVMRKHSGLTREALLRDYAELIVANKAERAKDKAEIARLKERLNDLEADDKNEVIRRMQRQVSHAESEKWRANEETRRAMSQVYVLKKRVAELEKMGIPL